MDVFISLFTDQDNNTVLNTVGDNLADIEQMIEHSIINEDIKHDAGARYEVEKFEVPDVITIDLGDDGEPLKIPNTGHNLIERYTVLYSNGKTADFSIYRKRF